MGEIKDSKVHVFRFDDTSINTDMVELGKITNCIIDKYPNAKLIYCISPICTASKDGRVFPQVFNALADYRKHYTADIVGVPDFSHCVPGLMAGHGIIHVNHQLLDFQAQELSILVSCSLAFNAKIFLPPWNQWDANTEIICAENNIELIKFEDGWRSAEHNFFDPFCKLWYLHPYAWTVEKFKEWLG